MSRKVAAGLVCAVLIALAGCTNGAVAPKVTTHATPSETTACDNFSKDFVEQASTVTSQQIQSVASQLKSSSNAQLQSEGSAIEHDFSAGDASAVRDEAKKVAATCFD